MARSKRKSVKDWAAEPIEAEVIPPGAVMVRRDAGWLRSIAVRMRLAAVELTIADVLDELERAAKGGQMSAVIAARPVKAVRANRYGPDVEDVMIEASWRDVRV